MGMSFRYLDGAMAERPRRPRLQPLAEGRQ